MIKLSALVESVKDRKDRSCLLSFGTRELSNEEFNVMRDMRGLEGHLIFSSFEVQDEDIQKELTLDKETIGKTASQRLRAVLFVMWKQQIEDGESTMTFNEFYASNMERIINLIKDKLK